MLVKNFSDTLMPVVYVLTGVLCVAVLDVLGTIFLAAAGTGLLAPVVAAHARGRVKFCSVET